VPRRRSLPKLFAAVLGMIRQRVQRLLVRRGLESVYEATGPADRLAGESSPLAGIVSASVQGWMALGELRGAAGAATRGRARRRERDVAGAATGAARTGMTCRSTCGWAHMVGRGWSGCAATSCAPFAQETAAAAEWQAGPARVEASVARRHAGVRAGERIGDRRSTGRKNFADWD